MTATHDFPAQPPVAADVEPTPPRVATSGPNTTAGQGNTHVLAIDPGNVESAYVVIDAETRRPIEFDKVPNDELRVALILTDLRDCQTVAIEMVASYGMPVGADVFETCVAIGRFLQLAPHAELVKRAPVKLHHCHTSKAKDSNITQALVDRFAQGASNHGKGTKANPGWFYGFKADIWQAYALAVYVADTTPTPVSAAAQPHAAAADAAATPRLTPEPSVAAAPPTPDGGRLW